MGQCDYKGNTKNSLKEHKEIVHENIRHACDQCDYKATRIGNLNVHKKLVHKGIKYYCDKCEYSTMWQKALVTHQKTKHEGLKHFCTQCSFSTPYLSTLKVHEQSEHEGVLHKCPQCEFQSPRKAYIKRHFSVVHEGKTFDCELCDYKAGRKTHLQQHMKHKHSSTSRKIPSQPSQNLASRLLGHPMDEEVKESHIRPENGQNNTMQVSPQQPKDMSSLYSRQEENNGAGPSTSQEPPIQTEQKDAESGMKTPYHLPQQQEHKPAYQIQQPQMQPDIKPPYSMHPSQQQNNQDMNSSVAYAMYEKYAQKFQESFPNMLRYPGNPMHFSNYVQFANNQLNYRTDPNVNNLPYHPNI